MSTMPCLSQMARSFSRYPFGGMSTPAEPATGSTMTAAMVEVVGELGAMLRLAASESVSGEVVGMADVVDAGEERTELLTVGDHAADGNAAEIDTMIAALAADQARARSLAAGALIGDRH